MRKYIVVLIVLFLAIKLCGLQEVDEGFQLNREIVNILQTGDLALITGDSYKSEFVKISDEYNNNYSHIGFVVNENNNSIQIVHMSIDTGCIEWENIEDYIVKSNLLNIDFYRLNNMVLDDKMYKILSELYQNKIEFDYSFDRNTVDKLYCSELIAVVLDKIDYKIQLDTKKRYIYPSEFTKKCISYKIYLTNK